MTIRRLITMIAMALTLIVTTEARAGDPESEEIERDKALHFSVSAVAVAGGVKVLQAFDAQHEITFTNRAITTVLVLGAGYLKEAHDAKETGNDFDRADFDADVSGAIFGNLLQWEF